MYIWTLGNTHWSVVDNAGCRWLRVPAGARPGAHAAWGRAGLLGCVPQMNWGFSHYGCVFFFVFISSYFKRKKTKTLRPTQMGFLTWQRRHSKPRTSSVAGTSSSSCSPAHPVSLSADKVVRTHTRSSLNVSRAPKDTDTVVFQIPGSFLFTLNTEGESVHTRFWSLTPFC